MTWRERTITARAAGGFTAQDRADAAMWATCAVGEQHDLHPDVVLFGEHAEDAVTRAMPMLRFFPMDHVLREYGDGGWGGFYQAVDQNDFDRAEEALARIEDRVLELKRAH